MSSLDGRSVKSVRLAMGRFGAWRADVVLTSGDPPTGEVTLDVAGLELLGTVVASGLDGPDKPRARIVGAPGWERALTSPLSYQSSAGVRLKTVLTDLASRAEETLEQPADVSVGTHFAAPRMNQGLSVKLGDVLVALFRAGHAPLWRVDPDGVTRFGAREATLVTARSVELRRDAGLGRVHLGIDEPAAFLPGFVFEGSVIRRLEVVDQNEKTEARIWQ